MTLSSAKRLENRIENCVTNLLEVSACCETDSFIKLKKSNIIFFKKLNQKGIQLKGITSINSKSIKISKESKYPVFEIQIWSFRE